MFHAGKLVLQQASESIVASSMHSDSRDLAAITSGLAELHNAGHVISDNELRCIQSRKQQLATLQRGYAKG